MFTDDQVKRVPTTTPTPTPQQTIRVASRIGRTGQPLPKAKPAKTKRVFAVKIDITDEKMEEMAKEFLARRSLQDPELIV